MIMPKCLSVVPIRNKSDEAFGNTKSGFSIHMNDTHERYKLGTIYQTTIRHKKPTHSLSHTDTDAPRERQQTKRFFCSRYCRTQFSFDRNINAFSSTRAIELIVFFFSLCVCVLEIFIDFFFVFDGRLSSIQRVQLLLDLQKISIVKQFQKTIQNKEVH